VLLEEHCGMQHSIDIDKQSLVFNKF
jgi:hypothetical protein